MSRMYRFVAIFCSVQSGWWLNNNDNNLFALNTDLLFWNYLLVEHHTVQQNIAY